MHSEAWLALHLPQLAHYDVPQHLHHHIYECVHDFEGDWSDLDAVAKTVAFPKGNASRHKLRVEIQLPLLAAERIFRVGHKWKFRSVLDAQTQLRHDEKLRNMMNKLIEEVVEKRVEELEFEEKNGIEKGVDRIVRHLDLLAYSIRFGKESNEMAYYVLNALGSRYVDLFNSCV